MKKKIIIIGAGPAGLTAGYKLLEYPELYDVIILEADSVVGGISRTVKHHGNRMDIGGHRFFSKDPEVNAMWFDIMPLQGQGAMDDLLLKRDVALNPDGPDPEKTDRVMLTRRRVSRIFYKKRFFDYPVKMNFSTIRNMGIFTTFAAGCSYLYSCLCKLPENSLENFYINRFGRKLYSIFFESYTEKLWGRHPRAISADWGAQRVKGLSISAVIRDIFRKLFTSGKTNETSLIEEFSYPKYGPGQLWETVAEKFTQAGGNLQLNTCVEKIIVQNGRAEKVVCRQGDNTFELECDILLSSMPVKDLIGGMNDVPAEVSEIASGLPYRDFVTVGLQVPRLLLKNETKLKTLSNIIPDCWIYVQDQAVQMGRIQIFNNWSPYLVADPVNTVWIGLEYFCSEGDHAWNMSEAQWIDFGVSELKRIGAITEDAEIQDSHVEKVRKAYPAYFDTYSRMDTLISWLDGNVHNLYCIGRNGQHRYNNMDHSMVTAFEAVKHIHSGGTGSKAAIWNVNTEKEYHEERK